MKQNGRARLEEGWVDYEMEREEREALEDVVYWILQVADPCCRDPVCGWHEESKRELKAARIRARAAGVHDQQPGEADWMEDHRNERPLDVAEMYLSVELGS